MYGTETSSRDREALELKGEGLRVARLVLAAPTRRSKPSGRPTCALTWANLRILQGRGRLGFPRRKSLQRGHESWESLSFLSAFLGPVTMLLLYLGWDCCRSHPVVYCSGVRERT